MKAPEPCIITFSSEFSPLRPAVGIVPLGYKKAFIDNEIIVIPDEDVASKVGLAFDLFAHGRTFREILPILKDRGRVSNRGNDLSLSSLHNMLSNPFYIGLIRKSRETYEGEHKPIISKSLYGRVQKRLRGRKH